MDNNWIITVEAAFKKATFTWSEDMQGCDVVAHGFEDEELDMLIANGAHEGADVDGYTVEIH